MTNPPITSDPLASTPPEQAQVLRGSPYPRADERLPIEAQLMAVGRVAFAAACLLGPGSVLRLLGFPDRSRTARTFAAMLGVRDLGMALCLWGAGSPPTLAKVEQACGIVDVADAALIGLAGLRDPRMRRAAIRNIPFAGASAAFSFGAARLSRSRAG